MKFEDKLREMKVEDQLRELLLRSPEGDELFVPRSLVEEAIKTIEVLMLEFEI